MEILKKLCGKKFYIFEHDHITDFYRFEIFSKDKDFLEYGKKRPIVEFVTVESDFIEVLENWSDGRKIKSCYPISRIGKIYFEEI